MARLAGSDAGFRCPATERPRLSIRSGDCDSHSHRGSPKPPPPEMAGVSSLSRLWSTRGWVRRVWPTVGVFAEAYGLSRTSVSPSRPGHRGDGACGQDANWHDVRRWRSRSWRSLDRSIGMYFDNAPCAICGSEVRLQPHSSEPRSDPNPDGTLDERVCTNSTCSSNSSRPNAESPDPSSSPPFLQS